MSGGTVVSPADRELVEAWITVGDTDAVRTLYRRHAPAVYRTVFRMVDGRREAADDITQETWLTVLEKVGSFRWRSAFQTWVLGIAVNKVREARRRFTRPADHENEPGDTSAPEHGMHLDIARALASLPDGYREVVVLHDLCGHTHAEIGRMLDIAEGTSKSQLHQARRRLRETLEDYAGRPGPTGG